MSTLRFSAIMEIREANPYILVNALRASALKKGWRKPLPVTVQINGKPDKPWHINMIPVGDGSFYLYLHGDVRSASETKVGDRVNVSLRFDETYKNGPQHPMPDWFHKALLENPKAHEAWSALPPSRKKEVLRYFDGLKSDEAREGNLEKALEVLSGTEGRFMARTWKNGR